VNLAHVYPRQKSTLLKRARIASYESYLMSSPISEMSFAHGFFTFISYQRKGLCFIAGDNFHLSYRKSRVSQTKYSKDFCAHVFSGANLTFYLLYRVFRWSCTLPCFNTFLRTFDDVIFGFGIFANLRYQSYVFLHDSSNENL
jgi:hypothetical protein